MQHRSLSMALVMLTTLCAHGETWPDPLVMQDGSKVTTAEQWREKRRPELVGLFETHVYGKAPQPAGPIRSTVLWSDPQALGGAATLKEVAIDLPVPVREDLLAAGKKPPRMVLLLAIPNHRSAPAPVVLGLNFFGNHAVLDDPRCTEPAADIAPTKPHARGSELEVWCIPQAIARGYAVATFYVGDVDPDRPDFTNGIQPWYAPQGWTTPAADEWGTLRQWAWGLSRAVDYLINDDSVDRKRIIVTGHSRNGKTALLAGAMDERISLVISHQSGCGGAAPSRTSVGETVEKITSRFDYWFAPAFKGYAADPARLPVDQHELIALVAPRPCLLTCATADVWSNPAGQFEMLRLASPVYQLLAGEALQAEQMPAEGVLVKSRLGYFIRPGKHSMTLQDWTAWLDYADVVLK